MDDLFGVKFFTGSAADATEALLARLRSSKQGSTLVVFTPNVEQLMLARRSPVFLAALQQADFNLPDSVGVVWAGNALGLSPFASRRIAGREMVSSLLPHLKNENKKVMLIGGKGDVAKLAAERLRAQYPGLQVGSNPGARSAQNETAAENASVMEEISAFKPDVVLVAYGAPAQESWVLKNKEKLAQQGVKIVMVVGGVLDLMAGKLSAPPATFNTLGLEWLWRLLQQPRRLGRQLVLPQFVFSVLKRKFSQ